MILFALLRLVGVIWFLGIGLLALAATSNYLFSTESQPERSQRWTSRLTASLIWPIALMSAAGRARLRRG